ncbi:MAG: hypothetical protein ACI82Z_001901 [Cellvibrionaceae bacterium]|jgi:hypothetical protein
MKTGIKKMDRRHWLRPAKLLLLSLGLFFTLTACEAVIPAAINLGKNLLIASTSNYSSAYAASIDEMLTLLKKPQAPSSIVSSIGSSRPLELNVALLKDGSPPIPIKDGAVLYDGRKNLLDSDRMKITFGSNQRCYVYVVAIDATGWVTPVFPSSESTFQNPISAGQSIQIPEGTRWYALDEYRGVETFYFLASRVRRPDIENLLNKFSLQVRSPIRQYQPVESPTIASRGIVAIEAGSPTRVQNQVGQTHDVIPTSFLAKIDSVDLVVTRWFYHK